MPRLLAKYTTVRLTTDLSALGEPERNMLRSLIDAARAMDEAFWLQAYGNKEPLLESISDPSARRFAEWNYGPWDRLDGNAPFLPDTRPKPPGANFYPADLTREEFEKALEDDPDAAPALRSPYTIVRRDGRGRLVARPYHEAFADAVEIAASKLRSAASLAREPALRRYLELRAEALVTSDYRASDEAWMEMKDNVLDIVIGPIETYEDQLFGYKAAFESFVLVKDRDWSARLARYAALLPELQRGLPVPDAYKQEQPGTDADLNAYDVVYYAGDGNAGSKTIAINLPNDEQVQLLRGARRLQLKNAMRAKFDEILVPITGVLIAEDQRRYVDFDAFFANTMFHEVAHGLGIKHTVTGGSTVREALRDQFSAIEEGKADVLGLYMVTRLHDSGQLGAAGPGDGGAEAAPDAGAAGKDALEVPPSADAVPTDDTLERHYVTFLAGIFRSVRFGAASAHGKANMVRFNFFREQGAFSRDAGSGTYRVDVARMRQAIDALSEKLLRLQGDGEYEPVREFVERLARVDDALAADLARIDAAGVPVDIVFDQGPEVLGL